MSYQGISTSYKLIRPREMTPLQRTDFEKTWKELADYERGQFHQRRSDIARIEREQKRIKMDDMRKPERLSQAAAYAKKHQFEMDLAAAKQSKWLRDHPDASPSVVSQKNSRQHQLESIDRQLTLLQKQIQLLQEEVRRLR
jgi:predicted  nucleic acid-binding Zn-ribbon protein